MQLQLDFLKKTRDNILAIVNNYSLEELNNIPKGFNNNLAWNAGHVLVTHQLLTYGLSGLSSKISSELINKYRKGTKPEDDINQGEIDFIQTMLVDTLPMFQEDYNNQIFETYKTYTTSYGVTLNSIEEAMTFNNMHEAMHLGTMIAIQKFL